MALLWLDMDADAMKERFRKDSLKPPMFVLMGTEFSAGKTSFLNSLTKFIEEYERNQLTNSMKFELITAAVASIEQKSVASGAVAVPVASVSSVASVVSLAVAVAVASMDFKKEQIRLSKRKEAFVSQCRKLHDVLRIFASNIYVGFDIRTLLPIMEIYNVITRIERELIEQQVTSVDKLLHLFCYIMPSKDQCAFQKFVEILAETGHGQLAQCFSKQIATVTDITENNNRIYNRYINQATGINSDHASVPSFPTSEM